MDGVARGTLPTRATPRSRTAGMGPELHTVEVSAQAHHTVDSVCYFT
ncbi:hypothetical protein FB390_4007 [Nocardia bhagyanarayanae]|uniref:Uncharacterized protein n=1 Tax=Nocardia bhagyanarayanae TaxID=1215925 RepID=A0A543FEM9_9NOCA|nr:hypothetical protein FB390_4007 [Nocardia bhagyanarayanae]